ncbi:MAG TPA: carboxypeptidase regulatory-like domain-containing protein [Longimicrobiaceae bacterium]
MKLLRPFVFLPALLLSAALQAQSFVGKVMDRAGEGPVQAATVEALGPGDRVAARARSAADGAFTLHLREPGDFRLRVQRIGYRTATSEAVPVAAMQTVRVELRISTSEIALDPLTVVARTDAPRSPRLEREGFYARQQMHVGAFVTRQDIERSKPLHSTETLRGIPGVRVHPIGGTTQHIAVITRRERGGCVPLLLVDNMVMGAEDLDLQIPPNDIEGIEVYRGPSEIPGRYISLASPCGLIVVWSRDGNPDMSADSAAADTAAHR